MAKQELTSETRLGHGQQIASYKTILAYITSIYKKGFPQ